MYSSSTLKTEEAGFVYQSAPLYIPEDYHHNFCSLKVGHLFSHESNMTEMYKICFFITEVHLVVVTQGHLLHHAETEVPLQKEAATEMDLHQMPHHLYWTSLKSLHQQFRKVVQIETLMQPTVIRALQDHGSRVLEEPLDQVKIIGIVLCET